MRLVSLVLLLAFAGIACADAGGDIADDINNVICLFVRLIWLVTGSLMALVIIFAGVKWLVSGEDAGARASAKTFIISAFVGLIIIFTAVPVVDYLVGSILGYEFSCVFFPEVDFSGSVLNVRDDSSTEPVSGDSSLGGEEPDLYVLAAGFSEEQIGVLSVDGSSPDSGKVPFCIDVGEQGGHTSAADVEVAVYLDKEGALEREEVCRETIPLVERGGYAQIACLVDREDAALVKAKQGSLKVEVDPEDRVLEVVGGKGNNNVERSGEGPDMGLRCGSKLQVQSVGDCSGLLNAQAKCKTIDESGKDEWSDYSKEIIVAEDTEMVVFYGEWNGDRAESFTWDLSWDYSGDKDNKQMFGLYLEDLPTEAGEYRATITVKTATETCSGTIEITVPSSGEEITPTKTCGELGGSCACPEGQECLNENKVAGSSDCPDTCCKCTPKPQPPACQELGGSCNCPEGQECLGENRITGSSDCPDTCCKCTPKTPIPSAQRPPQEELDRNCYEEGTTFVDLPGNPFITRDAAASALSGCYDLCEKNYLLGTTENLGNGQWWAGCCCRQKTEPIPVPCGSRGGSCTCPEGEECLDENKILGTTDCPATCCKCTQKAPALNPLRPSQDRLDGLCESGTKFFDVSGNPFTGIISVLSALSGCGAFCGESYSSGASTSTEGGLFWAGCCCRQGTIEPTPIQPPVQTPIQPPVQAPNVLHIVFVPIGYDMATQRAEFESVVAASSNSFLEKTPFRECKNKEDLVEFHILTDCPRAEAGLRSCAWFNMMWELKTCVYNSRWASVANAVQGVYNGDLSDFCKNFNGIGESGGYPFSASLTSSILSPRTSVHELGHNLGLGECAVNSCAMKSGGSGTEFCSSCYPKLKDKLSRYLVSCQR